MAPVLQLPSFLVSLALGHSWRSTMIRSDDKRWSSKSSSGVGVLAHLKSFHRWTMEQSSPPISIVVVIALRNKGRVSSRFLLFRSSFIYCSSAAMHLLIHSSDFLRCNKPVNRIRLFQNRQPLLSCNTRTFSWLVVIARCICHFSHLEHWADCGRIQELHG